MFQKIECFSYIVYNLAARDLPVLTEEKDIIPDALRTNLKYLKLTIYKFLNLCYD